MHRSRPGFALVELLLALALTGVVLALGTGMTGVTLGADARLREHIVLHESAIGGATLFQDLLSQAVVPAGEQPRFEGEPRVIRLQTRCRTTFGPPRQCNAVLRITRGDASAPRLSVSWDELSGMELGRLEGGARFIFAERELNDVVWRSRWGVSIRVPSAVGIVLPTDTLVYAMGLQ